MPVTLSGVTLRTTTSLSQWNPIQLFSSGEQGVWYDPSDFSTMFQDANGNTPVTAVEQAVGMIRDKSRPMTVGAEMVTNGDFTSNTTGWTSSSSSLASVSSELLITNIGAAFGLAYQTITTVVGKNYQISCTARAGTVSNVTLGVKNTSPTDTTYVASFATTSTTNVTLSGYFTATSTTSYIVLVNNNANNGTGFFDNVSVKPVEGNHATQSTSASRPVLSARYNLLTKTEEFSAAAWTKASSVVVTTGQADPLGGTTAAKVEIPANSAGIYQLASATIASGVAYKERIYIRADSDTTINLTVQGAGNANNNKGTQLTVNTSWQAFTFESTTSATDSGLYLSVQTAAITGASLINASRTIYIWGADLRVANDGIGLPSYQRVDTSTSYDTAGFPPYLRFDGVDDSLATGSINFTSTDKMTVMAGVRKSVGIGSYAVVAELSDIYSSNAGAFILSAHWNGANIAAGISGNSASFGNFITTAPFTPPVSYVNSLLADLGQSTQSAELVLRTNGSVESGTYGGSTVSGNFGNYPLYIGRRGGSAYPLNGRLYGLIVCGAAKGSGEISNTETWLNARTRAY